MKIIVAIDAFKGCLSSAEAGAAAEQAVRAVLPQAELLRIPIADGGEGTLEALQAVLGGDWVDCTVQDPLRRPIQSAYLRLGEQAFIESAKACGLPLLTTEERNPMIATSFGVGELIRHALEAGCRELSIGLGGSATNDAGMGLFQALGYRFLDAEGRELESGGAALQRLATIDDSQAHPLLKTARFHLICDVQNPLYGPEGAAYVFASQKGAAPEQLEALDAGLRCMGTALERLSGMDVAKLPGGGAAGGMGASLVCLLGAKPYAGIQWLLDSMHFDEKLRGATLLITGEGRADRQTLMGKAPYGLLQAAQKQKVPVVLFAGSLQDRALLLQAGFQAVYAVSEGLPLNLALQPARAGQNISACVMQHLRKNFYL
jgi:glycerate kinase